MPYKKRTSSHNFIDLTGKHFERLRVTRRLPPRKSGEKPRWECLCDCGKLIQTSGSCLRQGHTKSCGCLMIERTKEVNTRHGKKGTRVYRIWSGMHNRCRNPNSKDYVRYGARGIRVCDRWKQFERFYVDMGEPPTKGHEIERLDNARGYCPDNCVWATDGEQARNRRSNVVLEWGGRKQCACMWERELGLSNGSLGKRLRAGWSLQRTLTTRSRNKQKK
jgi:hypothetical protein